MILTVESSVIVPSEFGSPRTDCSDLAVVAKPGLPEIQQKKSNNNNGIKDLKVCVEHGFNLSLI